MSKLNDRRYRVVLPYPEGSRTVTYSDDLEEAHLSAAMTGPPAEIYDTRDGVWIETGPADAVRALRQFQQQAGVSYRFRNGRDAGKRPDDVADEIERRSLPVDWINTVVERINRHARKTLQSALASVPEASYVEDRTMRSLIVDVAEKYGDVVEVEFQPHEKHGDSNWPEFGCGRLVLHWDE